MHETLQITWVSTHPGGRQVGGGNARNTSNYVGFEGAGYTMKHVVFGQEARGGEGGGNTMKYVVFDRG